jgi:hypothetical protein
VSVSGKELDRRQARRSVKNARLKQSLEAYVTATPLKPRSLFVSKISLKPVVSSHFAPPRTRLASQEALKVIRRAFTPRFYRVLNRNASFWSISVPTSFGLLDIQVTPFCRLFEL